MTDTVTTPEERTRAVLQTQDFLLSLATHPSRNPDIPDHVRQAAERLLRHYPDVSHMYFAAFDCPRFFAKPEGYEKQFHFPLQDKPSTSHKTEGGLDLARIRDFVANAGLVLGIFLLAATVVTSYFLR